MGTSISFGYLHNERCFEVIAALSTSSSLEHCFCTMRILVLGGTGASGILLIREALAHSHTVVVYARSPDKLPEDIVKDTSVVIIKGDLSDAETLSKAMEGVDAVVSALGPAVKRGPFHPSGTPLALA
jgi:uncharacterized protein YbjT (DUF2867 family)